MEPVEQVGLTLTKPSVAQVIHWKYWKQVTRIPGDVREYIERVWAPKIPKVYEDILMRTLNNEHVSEQLLDILKTMVLMTPSLTPAALRGSVNPDGIALPSDVDLSHLGIADLERLSRKTLSAPLDHKEHARKSKHAAKMREKKARVEKGEATALGAHSKRGRQVDGGD